MLNKTILLSLLVILTSNSTPAASSVVDKWCVFWNGIEFSCGGDHAIALKNGCGCPTCDNSLWYAGEPFNVSADIARVACYITDTNHINYYRNAYRVDYNCPAATVGQSEFDTYDEGCACSDSDLVAVDDPTNGVVGCKPPPKDCTGGPGGNTIGNPCDVATGSKYLQVVDISGNLSLARYYNSGFLSNLGFGKGWRHEHQRKLIVGTDSLTRVSARGRGEPWQKVNGAWQGDADSDVQIVENATDIVLTKANGETETYDLTGQLLSTTDTNGHQTTYAYNASLQLESVTNHYGQSITFTYVSGNGNIDSVTDTQGAVYSYEYDADNNLSAVIFPDLTPNDTLDNPRKTYHYENTAFPNHLTGITDENGDRYATYGYDANGKAISTEHAQTTNTVGQEHFGLDY